jgi:peptidyl-prolyl cis-trans isomerase C
MRAFLLAAAAAVALTVSSVRAEEPAADNEDPVVATIDGAPVHLSEVRAAQQALPQQYRQMPIELLYDVLLARVVDMRLLADEAERRDLDERPEVQTQLAALRREVLRNQLLQTAIEEGTTDERLRAAYAVQQAEPGFAYEETRAAHILVASEEEARALIAEIKGGAEFAALARERSTDPSAAMNAGDLGWFRREQMVSEFAEAAFTIPPGTIGEDPVQSQFGWHVIRVDERRTVEPSFEDKEPELREQIARDIINEVVAELREGVAIETFNPDGTPRTE